MDPAVDVRPPQFAQYTWPASSATPSGPGCSDAIAVAWSPTNFTTAPSLAPLPLPGRVQNSPFASAAIQGCRLRHTRAYEVT